MKLSQKQRQRLSHLLVQNMKILQMSTQELTAYVQELALENPLVEPDELTPGPSAPPDSGIVDKLRWLEESDYQNRFYQAVNEDELDPFLWAGSDGGLEETLYRFIERQLPPLGLGGNETRAVLYLAACLDDDGYLRTPLEELAAPSDMTLDMLERGLSILQSLEPAGVGAADLAQCLSLQLERARQLGPALIIAREHLELLARGRYRAIAAKLGVSVEQVQTAARIIRELDPSPGAIFQKLEQVPYVQPDVFVTEDEDGHLTVSVQNSGKPFFHINRYYRDLLSQSGDKEVREYLSGKMRQAENVLRAVEQREDTILRCTKVIAERQRDFFRNGPIALVPLRLADVADELGIHESTVSRTVRGKYLQCGRGTYPLRYFFSRAAIVENGRAMAGGDASRELLKRLIDQEDKSHPLSDQKLSEQMARENIPISRRTVAKYRDEMHIPDASRRKLTGNESGEKKTGRRGSKT